MPVICDGVAHPIADSDQSRLGVAQAGSCRLPLVQTSLGCNHKKGTRRCPNCRTFIVPSGNAAQGGRSGEPRRKDHPRPDPPGDSAHRGGGRCPGHPDRRRRLRRPRQPQHRDWRSALRPHPCTGHSCDHCPTCERLGICCLTVRSGAQPVVNAPGVESLRSALVEDRAADTRRPSLRELADPQEAPVLPGSLPSGEPHLTLPPGNAASTVERLNAALDHMRATR